MAIESEDAARLRFQVELEFVQCLANPNYLHCKCCVSARILSKKINQNILSRHIHSHCPARLLQGRRLHQLPEVPAVLEGTGIRSLPEVPYESVLPGPAAVRALSAGDRQRALLQVHRRPGNSAVAALHAKAHQAVYDEQWRHSDGTESEQSERHAEWRQWTEDLRMWTQGDVNDGRLMMSGNGCGGLDFL